MALCVVTCVCIPSVENGFKTYCCCLLLLSCEFTLFAENACCILPRQRRHPPPHPPTHPTEVMMVSAGFKMFVASNRPPRPVSTTICSHRSATNKKQKTKTPTHPIVGGVPSQMGVLSLMFYFSFFSEARTSKEAGEHGKLTNQRAHKTLKSNQLFFIIPVRVGGSCLSRASPARTHPLGPGVIDLRDCSLRGTNNSNEQQQQQTTTSYSQRTQGNNRIHLPCLVDSQMSSPPQSSPWS